MPENDNRSMIHRLTAGDKEIILVGTAHVSRDSVRQVTETIRDNAPDTVCVELCESRFQSIRNPENWRDTNIVRVIRDKKSFLLLSNLMLASLQRRIAGKLDIKPGQEMIAAIDTADALGAGIHLADRDIRTTLARTWRIMGLWGKIKLLFQLILSLGEVDDISEADVEQMKQEDVLETLLADVGKSLPVLRDILIDERDRYLAHRIRTAPGRHIVAVVGAGHVAGIKKYWAADIDVENLETLPPPGKAARILKWGIPAGIAALLAYGFFRGGTQVGADMILWWILANGVLAGLGALMALGHPLTILASVAAAPVTSLNPMIAAGWVSGLVEAFLRKPQVRDFENLQNDIMSVRGFWHNKVTRILLVVAFTNLGSAVGTFVAIPMMMKML